jgi:MFS family permease
MVDQLGRAVLRRLEPVTDRSLPQAFWWLSLATLVIWSSRLLVPFLMILLTRRLDWSVGASSAVLTAYGAGGFAAVLVSGVVVDRFGARFSLLLSLIGAVVSTVALGLVHDPTGVTGVLIALGACLNAVGPASNALLAGLVPPDARLHGFALNYWVVNLGYAIAPVLAGLLSAWRFGALFVAQAIGLALAAVIVGRRLPRCPVAVETHTVPSSDSPRRPLSDRPYLMFLATNLVFQMVFVQCTVTLPVVTHQDGLSSTEFGMLLSLNGTVLLLGQLPAAAWLARWPRSWSLVVAAVLNAVGFGATELAHSWITYAVTVVIWTMGEAVNAPVAMSVSADLATAGQTGRYLGAFASTWTVALVLGPAVGGAVLDRLGARALWIGCALASLGCAAVRARLAPAQERRLADGNGTAGPTAVEAAS